jgi:hypothetical protein
MSWWSEKVYDPGWAEGGGWTGDLGGGQKEQTSSSELDPEMQQFRGEMFDFFRNNIANSSYTPYTGRRFASPNENLTGYFGGAGAFGTSGQPSGIRGANFFQGNFAAPTLGYMGASDYAARTSARMNPYEDQVVQQALSDIDREQALAQNQAGADVAKAKAFGSRGELYQAETNRQFADAKARTAANLRQQGYRDALSSVDAEQARTQQLGLQAAGMSADDAARAAQLRLAGGQAMTADQLTRLQALGAAGGVEQGLAQQQNDFDYQQFQEKQNFDVNKLNAYIAAMGGSPYGQTSTTNLYSNPLSGAMGTSLTLAALYGLLN